MANKIEWKRPQDIETYRTSDPKEMLGKYLPNPVLKKWNEDFVDSSTGETITIERNAIVVNSGLITQEKLQEIMFAIQSGDVEDVEICDDDISDICVDDNSYLTPYVVEMTNFDTMIAKNRFVAYAQSVQQAITIATEFGQMYRGFKGKFNVKKVAILDAQIVPDDHACIPEQFRTPAYNRKDYFKVEVRTEWLDIEDEKKYDTNYIIAASDVGQAKERISLMLDILVAEAKQRGEKVDERHRVQTVRKAVPFEVDCCVPREFSELYRVQK